jgi:hypothetical protein
MVGHLERLPLGGYWSVGEEMENYVFYRKLLRIS